MMRFYWVVLVILLLPACATTPGRDLDREDLLHQLQQLQQDTRLKNYLDPQSMERARAAIERMSAATRSNIKAHRRYLADKLIEIARFQAQLHWAEAQQHQLEQQEAQLKINIKAAEAELARREAEQALLLSRASQEEAERAREEARRAREERDRATREAQLARQQAEAAKRVAKASEREAQLARQEAELTAQAMKDLQKQLATFKARETARGLVVTLGDISFATGEAKLKDNTRAEIAQLVEFLGKYPNHTIRVEGHTDNRGSATFNKKLSLQRAQAVADALVAAGIPASRIHTVGYGEEHPIASNETPMGRSANRRVEIVIVKPEH